MATFMTAFIIVYIISVLLTAATKKRDEPLPSEEEYWRSHGVVWGGDK